MLLHIKSGSHILVLYAHTRNRIYWVLYWESGRDALTFNAERWLVTCNTLSNTCSMLDYCHDFRCRLSNSSIIQRDAIMTQTRDAWIVPLSSSSLCDTTRPTIMRAYEIALLAFSFIPNGIKSMSRLRQVIAKNISSYLFSRWLSR